MVSKIIDYKPSMDIINVSYPNDVLYDKIIEYINDNIESLKSGIKYYNFNDYIIYMVPYYYEIIDKQIFGGLLLMYFQKELLLNELKSILSKKEIITKNNIKNNIFSITKTFDYYGEVYYYNLNYNIELKLYLSLLAIISFLIGVIYNLLKIKIYKELKEDIIDDVEEFSKNLTTHKSLNEFGDEYQKEFKIDEINSLKNSYNDLVNSLKKVIVEKESAYNKLQTSNEQLIKTKKELENNIKKFDTFLKVISNIVLKNYDEKSFFDELLKTIIELIPNADYGSIVLREDGKWKYVSSYGHDYNILKTIEFDEKTFVFVNKTTEYENILEEDKIILSEDNYNKILKASKPFKRSILSPLKINDYVIGQISLDSKENIPFSEESIKILETFSIISSIFIRLKRISKTEGQLHKNIILILIKALEYYDKYTHGHSERVADIASEFAEYINLDNEEIKKVYWAGITHDIGKFFVPQSILNKPGRLNDEEYEIVKEHPVKSYELLASNPYLSEFSIIAKHHHERIRWKWLS